MNRTSLPGAALLLALNQFHILMSRVTLTDAAFAFSFVLALGAIVRAVEDLARMRGSYDVFALTLQPEFFAAIGYERVDRARYPEKIRRDCLSCARRFACNEICFAKNLLVEELPRAA